MTNAKNEAVTKEIVAWLRTELRLPEIVKVDQDTCINTELGVAGEDGISLINAFGKRFAVDTSMFPSDDYFGCEAGATPLTLLAGVWRAISGKPMTNLKPLSVSDLAVMLLNTISSDS